MDKNEVNLALMVLEYDKKWIEYEFIDNNFILEQFAYYKSSDDKNTEHYRYGAFRSILQNRKSLTDYQINQYIELATIDNDQGMAESVLVQLFTWNGLSEEQYNRLKSHPGFSKPIFQKLDKRYSMIKELGKIELTDEIVKHYIANGDGDVQLSLLVKNGITRKQLEYIHEKGINRRVRNIAKDMLRSRRYK
jgi:hypothetical protein